MESRKRWGKNSGSQGQQKPSHVDPSELPDLSSLLEGGSDKRKEEVATAGGTGVIVNEQQLPNTKGVEATNLTGPPPPAKGCPYSQKNAIGGEKQQAQEWICSFCRVGNFGSRPKCRRCHRLRPENGSTTSANKQQDRRGEGGGETKNNGRNDTKNRSSKPKGDVGKRTDPDVIWQLPVEVLALCFEYLPKIRDMCNARLVCTRWGGNDTVEDLGGAVRETLLTLNGEGFFGTTESPLFDHYNLPRPPYGKCVPLRLYLVMCGDQLEELSLGLGDTKKFMSVLAWLPHYTPNLRMLRLANELTLEDDFGACKLTGTFFCNDFWTQLQNVQLEYVPLSDDTIHWLGRGPARKTLTQLTVKVPAGTPVTRLEDIKLFEHLRVLSIQPDEYAGNGCWSDNWDYHKVLRALPSSLNSLSWGFGTSPSCFHEILTGIVPAPKPQPQKKSAGVAPGKRGGAAAAKPAVVPTTIAPSKHKVPLCHMILTGKVNVDFLDVLAATRGSQLLSLSINRSDKPGDFLARYFRGSTQAWKHSAAMLPSKDVRNSPSWQYIPSPSVGAFPNLTRLTLGNWAEKERLGCLGLACPKLEYLDLTTLGQGTRYESTFRQEHFKLDLENEVPEANSRLAIGLGHILSKCTSLSTLLLPWYVDLSMVDNHDVRIHPCAVNREEGNRDEILAEKIEKALAEVDRLEKLVAAQRAGTVQEEEQKNQDEVSTTTAPAVAGGGESPVVDQPSIIDTTHPVLQSIDIMGLPKEDLTSSDVLNKTLFWRHKFKVLGLRETVVTPPSFYERYFEAAPHVSELEEINLSEVELLTPWTLECIARRCISLRKLFLTAPLTPEFLALLAKRPSLEVLSIRLGDPKLQEPLTRVLSRSSSSDVAGHSRVVQQATLTEGGSSSCCWPMLKELRVTDNKMVHFKFTLKKLVPRTCRVTVGTINAQREAEVERWRGASGHSGSGGAALRSDGGGRGLRGW